MGTTQNTMASRLTALRPLLSRRAVAARLPYISTPRRTYATPSSNPTKDFYKQFTRPVAKVLLMAVLTYQLVYFGWMTLETEEIKAQADGESVVGRTRETTADEAKATIGTLEGKVDEYKKKIAAEATPEKKS